MNWKQGEDVIIVPAVSDAEAKEKYPQRLEGRRSPTSASCRSRSRRAQVRRLPCASTSPSSRSTPACRVGRPRPPSRRARCCVEGVVCRRPATHVGEAARGSSGTEPARPAPAAPRPSPFPSSIRTSTCSSSTSPRGSLSVPAIRAPARRRACSARLLEAAAAAGPRPAHLRGPRASPRPRHLRRSRLRPEPRGPEPASSPSSATTGSSGATSPSWKASPRGTRAASRLRSPTPT